MKKGIRLFAVLSVIALLSVGCKSIDIKDLTKPISVSTADNTDKPKDMTTNDAGTAGNETTAVQETTIVQETTTDAPKNDNVSVQEQVVFDQNDIKITLKSISLKEFLGPELKVLIENNSSQSITVQVRNVSVNGYMVETMFSADVASGKKANDGITLLESSLTAAGITTIADIELCFHIIDSSGWKTICDSEMIRVETSAAAGFTYTYDNSGDVVYNGEDIEIVVKGLSEDGSWLGPTVIVYISNAGKKDITVQIRDISINGFMIDSIFSCDVLVNKHAIDSITFLSSDLQENGIESIDNIELSFHVFDANSWDTIVDTPPVTINFK